jgi:hypothetical protein
MLSLTWPEVLDFMKFRCKMWKTSLITISCSWRQHDKQEERGASLVVASIRPHPAKTLAEVCKLGGNVTALKMKMLNLKEVPR